MEECNIIFDLDNSCVQKHARSTIESRLNKLHVLGNIIWGQGSSDSCAATRQHCGTCLTLEREARVTTHASDERVGRSVLAWSSAAASGWEAGNAAEHRLLHGEGEGRRGLLGSRCAGLARGLGRRRRRGAASGPVRRGGGAGDLLWPAAAALLGGACGVGRGDERAAVRWLSGDGMRCARRRSAGWLCRSERPCLGCLGGSACGTRLGPLRCDLVIGADALLGGLEAVLLAVRLVAALSPARLGLGGLARLAC